MQPRRGQQLVQSLERGLAALEMALDGSVRPSEVAEALGIDRSTAYRSAVYVDGEGLSAAG